MLQGDGLYSLMVVFRLSFEHFMRFRREGRSAVLASLSTLMTRSLVRNRGSAEVGARESATPVAAAQGIRFYRSVCRLGCFTSNRFLLVDDAANVVGSAPTRDEAAEVASQLCQIAGQIRCTVVEVSEPGAVGAPAGLVAEVPNVLESGQVEQVELPAQAESVHWVVWNGRCEVLVVDQSSGRVVSQHKDEPGAIAEAVALNARVLNSEVDTLLYRVSNHLALRYRVYLMERRAGAGRDEDLCVLVDQHDSAVVGFYSEREDAEDAALGLNESFEAAAAAAAAAEASA